MDLIEDGISISFNESHPSKALKPMDTKLQGLSNVILDKDLHPENAFSPIEVINEGIVICSSDEHPSKVFPSIFLNARRSFKCYFY